MLKLFYTLLTDPLGLPIEPLWEYVILLIVGETGLMKLQSKKQ